MGLEAATYISNLVASNPLGVDNRSLGDDHLRLIKSVLQTTFPNASRAFRFESVVFSPVNYAISNTQDRLLLFANAGSGAITVTLPPTAGLHSGFFVSVFKLDATANTVTIVGDAGDTINGGASRVLRVEQDGERYVWSSSEWKAVYRSREQWNTGDLFDASVTPVKLGAGTIAQAKSDSTTTQVALGTIPDDNTIPQISEGTQVFSLSITPTVATSKMVVEGVISVGTVSNPAVIAIALFVDGGANAIGVTSHLSNGGAGRTAIPFMFEHSPGDTSAHTYTLRVGHDSGTTAALNANEAQSAVYGSAGPVSAIKISELR